MTADTTIAPAAARLEMVLGQLADMDPGEAGFVVQRLLEQVYEERTVEPAESRAQTVRRIVRERDWDCANGPGAGV